MIPISITGLLLSFALIAPPLVAMLWFKVPLVRETLWALLRMTVQLLFVGLYLGVIFKQNNPWLTTAWVVVMLIAADFSILRGSGLRFARFGLPLLLSLAFGTILSVDYILTAVLFVPSFADTRIVIPLCGMILGNCLNSNVIGLRAFYGAIRKEENRFLFMLAQGATLGEAVRPYLGRAIRESAAPMVATMMSTGLVALPGMMTGVIVGGASPAEAVKYQLIVLLGIFCAAVITVVCSVLFSIRTTFTPFGTLRSDVMN